MIARRQLHDSIPSFRRLDDAANDRQAGPRQRARHHFIRADHEILDQHRGAIAFAFANILDHMIVHDKFRLHAVEIQRAMRVPFILQTLRRFVL